MTTTGTTDDTTDGSTTRWGIASTGGMARTFVEDLVLLPDAEVAFVGSRDADRAAAFAEPHGAGSGTYADLLAADLDVLYIATPHPQHHALALAAIEAGVPVLVEKAFTATLAGAEEVVAAARSRGVFCMEAMWTRFLPTIREMRHRVRTGALGPISQFSADLGFPYAETPGTASITAPDQGGGALHDLGIYGVSMAHDLLGPPIEIQAEAIRSASGSLRDVVMLLRHETQTGTALSTVQASHSTLLPNRLMVAGPAGRIIVDAPFITGRSARHLQVSPARDRPAPPSRMARTIGSSVLRNILRHALGREGKSFRHGFAGVGLRFQAEEVARCLADGKTESPVMPLEQTVEILDSLDRISTAISSANFKA